jgi:hypothetical protein
MAEAQRRVAITLFLSMLVHAADSFLTTLSPGFTYMTGHPNRTAISPVTWQVISHRNLTPDDHPACELSYAPGHEAELRKDVS